MDINYKIGRTIKFLPSIPLELKDLNEARKILYDLREILNEILKREVLNTSTDRDYWET